MALKACITTRQMIGIQSKFYSEWSNYGVFLSHSGTATIAVKYNRQMEATTNIAIYLYWKFRGNGSNPFV